jgi:hypothetical protein
MGNTVAKKRADQEDVDSDHLFANFLQPPRSSPTREILRRSPPSCQIAPTVRFWGKQRRARGKRPPFFD